VKFTVITLFPEFFESPLSSGLLGKAVEGGLVKVGLVDLRPYGEGKHRSTDDYPFGGGAGMVMMAGPAVRAIEDARNADPATRVVLLTPQGALMSQNKAREFASHGSVTFLCGRYEGFDERIRSFADEELSLGDFVLLGGESAALAVLEAVSRYVPGVLGDLASTEEESLSQGLLEYPHYTRPREFRGMEVPEVLLSGNHEKISRWRRLQSVLRTAKKRPDLLAEAKLTQGELEAVKNAGEAKDR
jgi:tRNA (guanine37-N1)-methyltransferase